MWYLGDWPGGVLGSASYVAFFIIFDAFFACAAPCIERPVRPFRSYISPASSLYNVVWQGAAVGALVLQGNSKIGPAGDTVLVLSSLE